MTLPEFLLARIAEDEDAAHYALSRGDGGALDYSGQWFGAITHAQRWEPTRVMVDCEARRKTVEAITVGVPPLGDEDANDGFAIAGAIALCFMALSYADHPDYREEWRP